MVHCLRCLKGDLNKGIEEEMPCYWSKAARIRLIVAFFQYKRAGSSRCSAVLLETSSSKDNTNISSCHSSSLSQHKGLHPYFLPVCRQCIGLSAGSMGEAYHALITLIAWFFSAISRSKKKKKRDFEYTVHGCIHSSLSQALCFMFSCMKGFCPFLFPHLPFCSHNNTLPPPFRSGTSSWIVNEGQASIDQLLSYWLCYIFWSSLTGRCKIRASDK